MKRTILSIAMALCVSCMPGQSNEVYKLSKIKGVQSIHFDKNMITNMIDKEMEWEEGPLILDFDFLKDKESTLDDIQIYSCQEKKAANKLKKTVSKLLLNKNQYQELININRDGTAIKAYCRKEGNQNSFIIFGDGNNEEEIYTTLVIIKGNLDITTWLNPENY